jgi:hypothetical protein
MPDQNESEKPMTRPGPRWGVFFLGRNGVARQIFRCVLHLGSDEVFFGVGGCLGKKIFSKALKPEKKLFILLPEKRNPQNKISFRLFISSFLLC